MRVAVVQTNPIFGEKKSNIINALEFMDSVHADIYVLPELFATGYNFIDMKEVECLSENADGYTFSKISDWAKKNSCYIVYGFAEKADNIYNSSALVGPKGLIGIYRKVHLFDRENLFFASGNLGFPVFDLPFGKIGMMICFDWIYPESARSLALQGAQIIAHPANLILPYCPDAMITRCLENRVFSVTANRIGKEDRGGINLSFIGTSEIVAPDGKVMKKLSAKKEEITAIEIDLSLASNKKINEYNDLLAGRKKAQYKFD
jgi:predicted amidohydrolase